MTTPRNQESLAPHHVELAALLAAARRDAKQIPELPSELVPATPDDAYAVNRLTARLLGWELLGWKIAGTTAAMREKLRLDTPIHGRTYRRFAVNSPARFAFAELLDPLVESDFLSPWIAIFPHAKHPGPCKRWPRPLERCMRGSSWPSAVFQRLRCRL
jgi:hypothetical protein